MHPVSCAGRVVAREIGAGGRLVAGLYFNRIKWLFPAENRPVPLVGTLCFRNLAVSFIIWRMSNDPNTQDDKTRLISLPEAAELYGFNPQYLLDFIAVCNSESVSVSLKDSETQGLFRPIESSDLDYRYVVMPMKI